MLLCVVYIFQNFKNSKPFEPSKYKKTTKFGPKKCLNINDYEKPTKKEGRKKRQPSKTPSFFFFLSSYFAFIFFCWFLRIICFEKFVWSKFGRFFIFRGFEQFRILEILSYTFFGR